MFKRLIASVKNQISEYKRNNSLPGQWKLYEYYTEPGNELLNIKPEQVRSEKHTWDIVFEENGGYQSSSNLKIPIPHNPETGKWSRAKNFVTLIHPDDFRKSIEFQFAFEKGNLKLLKKDDFGRILVFAFFERVN